jgi:hypothetical protein
MEELFKQYLPIVFFLYTIIFWAKNRNSNIWVLLLLFENYLLGSNYSFGIYRIVYQGLLIMTVVLNLKNSKRIPFNILKLLFCFVIAILISGFNNILSKPFIDVVINFIINASAILFLCYKMNEKNTLNTYLKFISNLGWILSIFAVICFAAEPARIELVSSNPNYFAFSLGISFIISLFINSKFKLLVNLIILLGIFTTASRSILLICVLIFLITQLEYYKSKIVFIIPIFLIVLPVLFFISNVNIVNEVIFDRFSNMEENAGLLMRFEIMDISKKIFVEHPINGIGYGQFMYLFLNYSTAKTDLLLNMDTIVTHNDYLRILTELGIIGAITFFIIVFSSLKNALTLDSTHKKLTLSLIAMALFNSGSHNNLNTFVFWLILFLPIAINNFTKKSVTNGLQAAH